MCGCKISLKLFLPIVVIFAMLATGRAGAVDSFLSPQPTTETATPSVSSNGVRQATHSQPLRDDRPTAQTPSFPKLSPPPSESGKSTGASPLSAIFTVLGSLAVVLGLFVGVAWLMRRGWPSSARRLPSGVVEVLGNAPLATRQQMHVLRFGGKLLLVCVSQNGVETLSEIEDTAEVERLTGLCQSSRSIASIGKFDQVLGKRMRGAATEHNAGGLATMAFRKKSAPAGDEA
jgi:flagellar biogenesis protein FliO